MEKAEIVKPKKYKNKAVSSIRARNVVNEALELIGKGQQPNFYQLQIKHGYSPSSAKGYSVQRTKEWDRLKEKLDDDLAIDRISNIIKNGKDSDALKAIDMQWKAKNFYPTKVTANFSVQRKIEELYD